MINEENLTKLYKGVVNNCELTTRQLNEMGFNSHDITALLERGTLQRKKRGQYTFTSFAELMDYANKLIKNKDFEELNNTYKRGFEMNPSDEKLCLQLFYRSLKSETEGFKYLDVLLKSSIPSIRADGNLFLYLLFNLGTCPAEYLDIAKNITFEDVKICDNYRHINSEKQNLIRRLIFDDRYACASKHLNELLSEQKVYVQDLILKRLLRKMAVYKNNNMRIIIRDIKESNYRRVIEFLVKRSHKEKLSLKEQYILKLAQLIINIIEKNQMPKLQSIETTNVYEAIDKNDFQKALELAKSYNASNNLDNNQSEFYLLLSDVCDLLYPKKNQTNEKNDTNVSFSKVVESLISKDYNLALSLLKSYLLSINKSEYEEIIIELIALDLSEKNVLFTNSMTFLTEVSDLNFTLDVSLYIKKFYQALAQNDLVNAKRCLNIINASKKYPKDSAFILTLNSSLVVISTSKIKKEIKSESEVQTHQDTLGKLEESKPVQKNNPQRQNHLENQNNCESLSQTEVFISEKFAELKSGRGMVLLKPMPENRIKEIMGIVKKNPDFTGFVIEDELGQRVVIRYTPYMPELLNIQSLRSKGDRAYSLGAYQECISHYQELLHLRNPQTYVYVKIGLANLKMQKNKIALEYLTVANELSKIRKEKFDFTDLINILTGTDVSNLKTFVNIREEELKYEMQDYYGIDNISDITKEITESGLDVKTACEKIGLTPEQINLIYLIYAREYYFQNDMGKGDEFLRAYEKSDNKSKLSKKIYREILLKKKFYFNRLNEQALNLSLSLKSR